MRMNISSLFTQFRKLSFVHFIHNNLNHVVNSSENGQTHKDDWIHSPSYKIYKAPYIWKRNNNFESIVIGYGWVGFSLWFTSRAPYVKHTRKNGKRLYILGLPNALRQIKSARSRCCGIWIPFFANRIVADAVVIVIIRCCFWCRRHCQRRHQNSCVMLWRIYVIM